MTRFALLLLLVTAPLAHAQNVADGRDVYGPCAACHGANGEGGKGGEYPRVAGQPPSFTIMSLKHFQERKRMNLPMFPYTEPRELSESDMKDVAAFLAAIKLPARAPEFKDTDSALDRLVAMEKVLVVPRVEGDVKEGKALYRKQCGRCHGAFGHGREEKSAPRLLGQYPDYLLRQVEAYRKGERGADPKDPMNGTFSKLTDKQVTDILAWLTSVQEMEEEPQAAEEAPAAE